MKPTNLRKIDIEVESLLNMGLEGDPESIEIKKRSVANLKYIYDMLMELRAIAKSTSEESLVYYLEMSAMEASDLGDALKMKLDEISDQGSQSGNGTMDGH